MDKNGSVSGSKYSFEDALISKRTAAYDISKLYDQTLAMIDSISFRLQRRQKWIQITKSFARRSFAKAAGSAKRREAEYVYRDVMSILWQSFTRKVLFRSRIYNLKYFCFLFDDLWLARSDNIRTHWKV